MKSYDTLKVTKIDALCAPYHHPPQISSPSQISEGSCVRKCQKAPNLLPLSHSLLFSLKAFPMPQKISPQTQHDSARELIQPSSNGVGVSSLPLFWWNNFKVDSPWFLTVLSRINPIAHRCNKINYVPFLPFLSFFWLLLFLVSLSYQSC